MAVLADEKDLEPAAIGRDLRSDLSGPFAVVQRLNEHDLPVGHPVGGERNMRRCSPAAPSADGAETTSTRSFQR